MQATVDQMIAGQETDIEAPLLDANAPLYSLEREGGAGALLAAAAGDVAGGVVPDTYGANTQFGTVFAYHLMRNGGVDRDALQAEVLLLDGVGESHRTYRGESPDLRQWMDSAAEGAPAASTVESAGPSARSIAAGLRFRDQPDELVAATLRASRLTNLNAVSTVMAVATAGAVAASTYHQIGADLFAGVAETADRALSALEGEEFRFSDTEGARRLPERIRLLSRLVGESLRTVVGSLSLDNGPVGVESALLGLALGGDKNHDPVKLIGTAAQAGGSDVAIITGAIVGARNSTRRWPWRVPNDTWFAEIGKRLVQKQTETRDLPIPYAVEERVVLNIGTGPSIDG